MASVLDISEARRVFNTLDERLREEPVIYIHRHNKPSFAIIDIDHLEALVETMEILCDPEAMDAFEQSLDDIRNGRLHDHEDVKKELW